MSRAAILPPSSASAMRMRCCGCFWDGEEFRMSDELTREDRTELFLMQVRGSIATAFIYANIKPTNDEMCLLYAMGEMTTRQMGEIAARTGFNLNLQLHDIPPRPTAPKENGDE